MKKIVIVFICGLFISGVTKAKNCQQEQPINELVMTDCLRPAMFAECTGFIGDMLDLSYRNRILAQDYHRLVSPFIERTETSCWQTEFWGKWYTSAVLAYRYRPEPALRNILEKAANELISTQTSDGYIGNYIEGKRLDAWDIWGRKYCMLGLISWYDLTNDNNALSAACKEADCLIKELAGINVMLVKKGSHKGMAASSVLEPICLLYARTKDKKYLDFAEEIVRQWETPEGPQLISKAGIDVSKRFPVPEIWYGPEQGQKAYEMMSCYEGLLELYRITGKEEYKNAVEKTWENIHNTEINIVGSGSSMECWFGGNKFQTLAIHHYQETCVTATWIKLTQQLLRLTGEAKYADAIEKSYYNALLGAMKPDGSSWGYYSPLSGYKIEREEQCGMGIHCCKASGPRALFTFPITAVMSRNEGLQINFFAGGVYTLETPSKQNIKINQVTDYPANGKINFKIELAKAEEMSVWLRIPEWSKVNTLKINGESIQEVVAGRYAIIKRKWSNGDEINLELDMRGRVISQGVLPQNLAIVRGPMVLARDSRLTGPVIDAWITPQVDKDGYLILELAGLNQNGIWMQFNAECKYEPARKEGELQGSLSFCDYASAGNTYDESSRFRVWFPQEIDPRSLKEK